MSRAPELNDAGLATRHENIDILCRRKYKFKLVSPPFWTAELYGFGLQISKYGYYPYFLPLCIYTDHGPGYYDEMPRHEINSGAPINFFHSPKSIKLWDSVMKRKASCLFSPFVFYRRLHDINIKNNARGTVAFPAHSTPSIDDKASYKGYIQSLMDLPERYHPITVCMHMHDINKGLHKDFIEAGFNVETAGNTSNQDFISKFYLILTGCKYATSNVVGSYAYYCIEMGIPFFTYGEKPSWINKFDANLPEGRYSPWEYGYGRVVDELFQARNICECEPYISEEQRNFVETHLGVFDGVSRREMAFILYSSLLKFLLSTAGVRHLIANNVVSLMIKKIFDRLVF